MIHVKTNYNSHYYFTDKNVYIATMAFLKIEFPDLTYTAEII